MQAHAVVGDTHPTAFRNCWLGGSSRQCCAARLPLRHAGHVESGPVHGAMSPAVYVVTTEKRENADEKSLTRAVGVFLSMIEPASSWKDSKCDCVQPGERAICAASCTTRMNDLAVMSRRMGTSLHTYSWDVWQRGRFSPDAASKAKDASAGSAVSSPCTQDSNFTTRS